jgi:hypothetical protein
VIHPQFVRVDLNAVYGEALAAAGRPLERLCAYAVTQLVSAEERRAFLELSGPHLPARAWIGGEPVTPGPFVLSESPRRWPLRLATGETEVLVEVCKQAGPWYFMARVTDAEGRDLDDLGIRANLREGAPEPPRAAGQGAESG